MTRKFLELLQTVPPKESITFEMDLTTLCAYLDACCRRLLEDAADAGRQHGESDEKIDRTLFATTTTLLLIKMLMCDKYNFERCARESERINSDDFIIDFESED